MKKKELTTQTKKATKTVAKNAVTNWQPILILLGIGIASYISYKAVTKVTDGIADWNPGNPSGSGGGNQDPTGGNTTPPNATITDNQASIIAAGLHQAMTVWDGTDEQRIFSLLKGKTKIDYAMISNAFGTPRYDDFGDAYWPFPRHPLSYWLNSELDEQEYQHLKTIMPGVL